MRHSRALAVTAAGVAAAIGFAPAAQAHPSAHPTRLPSWQLISTGSTEHFRGLAAVSRSVAWLGGYDGTVLRTTDGGRHWQDVSPAGAGSLQFRDISASDAWHAVAMAAGGGTDSRLYQTSDGGRHWQLAYQNTDPAAFFDCMSFSDRQRGLVLSDPVDGKFRILATSNGGRSWRVLPNAGMPAAQTGEAGFAASGECLTTAGRDAWFGSGGGATARIFHSRDGGYHWSALPAAQPSSPSSGVFGLAVRAGEHDRDRAERDWSPSAVIAVGGDFANPTASAGVAGVLTRSGWRPAASQPSGYRSGVTWLPGRGAAAVAVGLTGSDISFDGGWHWTTFDTGQFDTVSCTRDGACWAAGDLGRVAVLQRG